MGRFETSFYDGFAVYRDSRRKAETTARSGQGRDRRERLSFTLDGEDRCGKWRWRERGAASQPDDVQSGDQLEVPHVDGPDAVVKLQGSCSDQQI
jgi:hypothetical protein